MAGVSISTVSRVVNNSKPVNEEIKKRVMDAIRQTNYRPDVTGTGSAPINSMLIGIIIPHNSNTVLDDFSMGIRTIAELYGYDIMFGLTDGSVDNELHYMKMFQRAGAQGLILVGSELDKPHLEILGDSPAPCVLAGQQSNVPFIPSVHLDNITASYEAVTYLIQKGHRRIAMIRVAGDNAVGGDRYKGYSQALANSGIALQESWVAECGLSAQDGMDAMRRIMESGAQPTAIFCSTDWMAVGAMNYLLDQGLRIPEDISVFGFDNSLMSTLMRPRLSSVDYSGTEIGMTAARHLIKLMRGETVTPHHANVAHYLQIRESTGEVTKSTITG